MMEKEYSEEEKRIIAEMSKVADRCRKNIESNEILLNTLIVSPKFAKMYDEDMKRLFKEKYEKQ